MSNEKYSDLISQGIALMAAEKYEVAKEIFERALAEDERSAETYIHIGNANANMGQFEEALLAFRNALSLEPEAADVLFSIGSVYLLSNNRIKAVEYFNKAEEAGMKTASLYQMLATIFYEAGDDVQALRNISKAIAAAPLDGELRLLKTRIYLAEDRLEEAMETLEDMHKLLPDAFEAYDLRAQIYTTQGKYDKALEISELGCSKFPNDPVLALTKLKVLVSMKNVEEGLAQLAEMKKLDNFTVVLKEATMQEAILLLQKEDADGAIAALEATNEKLGGDAELLFVLVDLYAKLDRYEETIRTAEAMMHFETNPHFLYTAKYFRAHAMEKRGKTDEAKAEYRKLTSELRRATIQRPSFYEGYIYRLLCHTNIGEYEKALELADYIENLRPDLADAHSFRYFIYNTMGDKEKAEEAKQKALQINPTMKL